METEGLIKKTREDDKAQTMVRVNGHKTNNEEYLHNSDGLLLNATSIITGTCSNTKEEINKAGRLALHDSPRRSTKKVKSKKISMFGSWDNLG